MIHIKPKNMWKHLISLISWAPFISWESWVITVSKTHHLHVPSNVTRHWKWTLPLTNFTPLHNLMILIIGVLNLINNLIANVGRQACGDLRFEIKTITNWCIRYVSSLLDYSDISFNNWSIPDIRHNNL